MKYWASFIKYECCDQNSGDYIFRPIKGQYEAINYSKFHKAVANSEQMDFHFQSVDEKGEIFQKIIVHLTIDPETYTMKFDVDLGSLPPVYYNGYEVTANFHIDNFDNNQTFWTDSNGLEMQKRILNYRPTWDLVNTNYKDALQNITANFYPINSAITMRDINSDRAFTVMNDRSQSGSAIKNGNIEFMQNRRIPADDGRGMGENLDEMDEFGNGIRVPASYYLQIYRAGKDKSTQREVQAKTDTPAQFFYSFGAMDQVNHVTYNSDLADDLSSAGINGTVKMVALPMAKNTLLVRLENIADLIDKESVTRQVALEYALTSMYKAANKGDQKEPKIEIRERSLSGNMDLSEMLKRKIQWKTVDDDKNEFSHSKISFDTQFTSVDLEPQRIRTFLVTVTPCEEQFLQI